MKFPKSGQSSSTRGLSVGRKNGHEVTREEMERVKMNMGGEAQRKVMEREAQISE